MGVDRNTFRTLLRPLCTMYRVTFDVAHWTVYYQALSDVSPALLEAAIVLVAREDRPFMPRPGEIRAFAEQARLATLAANPWQLCNDCKDAHGFIDIIDDAGVKRLTRCACYFEHRQRMEVAGVPARSLIEQPRVVREDEALWADIPTSPDPRRLPREVASDIKRIARDHTIEPGASVQTDIDGRPLGPRRLP